MKRSFGIMLLAYMTMLLALLMTACSYSPSNSVFCDGSSPYLNILPKALPQYDIRAVESGYEAERLGSSIAVEVFDYQAETLMQSSRKLYWYPQYAVTVVIAVDRDKTCADIRGWESLLNCDGSIMLSYNEPFNCCFAAVSYGLCGEDFDMDGALKLFKELEQTGRMTQNADADIQICFDYQAAAQMKAGRKLEIIIPEEGTLSFTKGLLSNKELKLPVHMDILLEQSGLRTDEGEADRRLYPMESEYARAKKLDDYTKMLGATESAWARYKREAQHKDLFTTADGREHIIAATAAIAVVVAWAGTMIGRLLNRQMRVIVFIAAAEMVLWLLVRTIKWQLPIAGALNRYLWYSFYLFQLGLPVTMLRLTVSIGAEGHAAAPRWWKVCLMVNILAFLLVLTNDMHMLVFRMDLSQPGWSGNYSYGIGYFAVCMVNAACIFLTLMLLIKKCGKTPRRNALLFPIGLCVWMLAYCIMYALRIPIAWEGDFTITAVLFFLLFMESAMRTGLIPVNSNYPGLFSHSVLNMQIVTPSGDTMLSSANARPLEDEVRRSVDFTAQFVINTAPDIQLSGMPIAGGAVVWQEDMSAVHELQRRLSEIVQRLERGNALLKNERDLRERAEALRVRQSIHDELESTIHTELMHALDIVKKAGSNGLDAEEALRLHMLLCYCKRRSNMLFQQKQASLIDTGELKAHLEELVSCADKSGLKAAVRVSLGARLSPEEAAGFYEFMFYGLSFALERGWSALICNISNNGDNTKLVMRLLAEGSFDGIELSIKPKCGRLAIAHDGFLHEASLTIDSTYADREGQNDDRV